MNRRNKNTIAAPAPPPPEAPAAVIPQPAAQPISTYLPTWKRLVYFTAPFIIYLTAFFGPFLEYDELATGTREGFMVVFSFLNELIFKETGHKLTRPLLVLAIQTWKVVTIWGALWLPAAAWLCYRHKVFEQAAWMFNAGLFWVIFGWVAGAFCCVMYSAPLILDWWILSIGID
jgi:hypothetical protein